MRKIFIGLAAIPLFCVMPLAVASVESGRGGGRDFGEGASSCPARILEDQGLLVDDETTISFLGTISAGHREYWIYLHDHVYRRNYRETRHLIIMERGCAYLGAYFVPAKPIGIRGGAALFDVPEKVGNVIRFSDQGPPPTIWIEGEVFRLAGPAEGASRP